MTEGEACLNCGAVLAGPYCASCGQEKRQTDPTLRELMREATHELTQWDGKIPRTLQALFLKPGLLTLDVLAGRRARWLPPLRLYLICSVGYFVSEPLMEAITHRSAHELASITVINPDGTRSLTPEGRAQIGAGLPARVFGVERLEHAVVKSDQFDRATESALPKGMFVLLPLFALLTRGAWRRQLPRYPAHLYTALHLHAAWFGALTVSTVVTELITSDVVTAGIELAVLAYVVWYGLVALRRVFGDSWLRTLAKSAAVAVAYSMCLFAMSLAMLGYVLATI